MKEVHCIPVGELFQCVGMDFKMDAIYIVQSDTDMP